MVPLGLPEQGKRQSWHSSGLGLLVTSSLAERFCSSCCCQLRRRGGQMWTTADVWASQCGCAQMLWHHPASAAVTVTSLITAREMILWKPCRSKLVSAGWKLPTVSLLGWEIHEDFKWTLVLLGWRSGMQPVGLRSENCYWVSSFVSSWYSEPIHLLNSPIESWR